jgi:hypothetical protein
MRTVELAMDGDSIHATIEMTDRQEFYNAIGYLATWGSNAENEITRAVIGVDWSAPDMIAHYYKEDGTRVFTLGAVWHDDHFGFHS